MPSSENVRGTAAQPSVDAMVESMVREGPLRRPPPGLFRRIKDRLAVIAIIQQEQKQFRYIWATACLLVISTVAASGMFAFAMGLPGILVRDVPGGMGYYDYATASLQLSLTSVLGMLVAVAAIAISVMIIAAVYLARRRGGSYDDTLAV